MSPYRKSSRLFDAVFSPSSGTPRTGRDAENVMVAGARLPMDYWEGGWVFRGIEDLAWRAITTAEETGSEQIFPATLRPNHKSHPAYVLSEVGNYALRICPLTSRPQTSPYIPDNAILEKTGFRMDRDSFLVLGASVVLPRRAGLFPQLPVFLGIWPPDRLVP